MTEREKMLRKQIARIISPKTSFEDFEGIVESQFQMDRRAVAYKKADAVIAALSHAPADGEADAEIQRLQDAKRRALAIADERAKENVALRAALLIARQWVNRAYERCAGDDLSAQLLERDLAQIDAALSNARPASEGVREALNKANYKMGWWLSGALDDPQVCAEMKADINAWFEAHQPGVKITGAADTPDEGPDPLGYAKGERA